MNYHQNRTNADIKTVPEDFIVNEILDFELTGQGEHLWCYVEKVGMNTSYLERQWAKILGCQRRQISHSGLKDRHAKTRQWICLPATYDKNLPNESKDWQILKRQYHQKKLKIGTHKYNEFVITLRNIEGNKETIDSELTKIREQGFLNTFGEQRFGHHNLEKARDWVSFNKLPKKREERAQVLSTLRAFLFNEQVNLRAQLGLTNQLLIGDRAMLTGSHSHFVVNEINEEINERLSSGDITPGGWLVGKEKTIQSSAEDDRIRKYVLKQYSEAVTYLKKHCQEDWRPIIVRPSKFEWEWHSEQILVIRFMLPKGSFATSLLEQVFKIRDKSLDN